MAHYFSLFRTKTSYFVLQLYFFIISPELRASSLYSYYSEKNSHSTCVLHASLISQLIISWPKLSSSSCLERVICFSLPHSRNIHFSYSNLCTCQRREWACCPAHLLAVHKPRCIHYFSCIVDQAVCSVLGWTQVTCQLTLIIFRNIQFGEETNPW